MHKKYKNKTTTITKIGIMNPINILIYIIGVLFKSKLSLSKQSNEYYNCKSWVDTDVTIIYSKLGLSIPN